MSMKLIYRMSPTLTMAMMLHGLHREISVVLISCVRYTIAVLFLLIHIVESYGMLPTHTMVMMLNCQSPVIFCFVQLCDLLSCQAIAYHPYYLLTGCLLLHLESTKLYCQWSFIELLQFPAFIPHSPYEPNASSLGGNSQNATNSPLPDATLPGSDNGLV